MDTTVLQTILYVLGAGLLIALIVLVIKIIYSVNHLNVILESVEKKMKTVDKAFGAVDRVVDSLSFASDKIVDGISGIVGKVFSHKKKNSRIDKIEEED